MKRIQIKKGRKIGKQRRERIKIEGEKIKKD
jgi:hypothetical protein